MFAQAILGRNVDYFDCPACGYVQTETPSWLAAAYATVIDELDTGIMLRNLRNAADVVLTLAAFGRLDRPVLDYAGGYGTLVRLLRDAGIEAHWTDKYCQNIFARGFERSGVHYELVTAFEVFEHLEHPLDELRAMLDIAPTVLLSTDLITTTETPPPDWWYYGPEHGQHIGFFRMLTLDYLAHRLRLHLPQRRTKPAHLLARHHSGLLGPVAESALVGQDREAPPPQAEGDVRLRIAPSPTRRVRLATRRTRLAESVTCLRARTPRRRMQSDQPLPFSGAAPAARLSIGMVTFNAAPVLERALQSISRHKTSTMELVVVDGASGDGTLDILRRHADGIDHWRSEPDSGIYDAMNKVLKMATGDWLLFLGADDELLASPDRLLARCKHPDAVYYGNVRIRASGQVSGGQFSRYRLMQENICHQSILYPRSAYKHKAYDTGCGLLADHRYNIELMGSGVPFMHVDETISLFNDAGRSSVPDINFESVKLAAIRSSFGWPFYAIKRLRSACVRLLKGHVSPLEYITASLDDWPQYLMLVALFLGLHSYIIRRWTVGIYDPLFVLLISNALGWAIVWFMYLRGDIASVYALTFTAAQLALYLGMGVGRWFSGRTNFAPMRKDEALLPVLTLAMAAAVHVASTLAIWALMGIPLLRDSRLGGFQGSGGLGILERLADSSSLIGLFSATYVLLGWPHLRRNLPILAFLFWYATTMALSGSKGALLSVGQYLLSIMFVYGGLRTVKSRFWGGTQARYLWCSRPCLPSRFWLYSRRAIFNLPRWACCTVS